eukprot:TRINITY_DN5478_c0_g1_i1.p1 TRINITY_DN5478_c0_g1~~TRINITY_DN5478_c0_g1_i1.p1  ORF type:complete len:638 (-),score=113.73 TRINITY_DN5478_c0_g1_i1:109-2022(-)
MKFSSDIMNQVYIQRQSDCESGVTSMNTDLIKKITELKIEKNAIILAHYYQPAEIQAIADYVGDSYYLSEIARDTKEEVIVFCGVKFMAESAKILSPDKTVIMPYLNAGCSMADMANVEELIKMKEKYPQAYVVCYINSTCSVKSHCDVAVTSSSALKIIKNIPNKQILFLPDKNLGGYISEFFKDKEFVLWDGFCRCHNDISKDDILKVKNDYKDAKILVHPECSKEVRDMADFIGSTGEIIKYAGEDKNKVFIIGTEEGILYELQNKNPEKKFIIPGGKIRCKDMKKTTLQNLYYSLLNMNNEIILDENTRLKAMKCLENMHLLNKQQTLINNLGSEIMDKFVDVLIVGTGVSGLYCALNLEKDLDVLVVCKEDIKCTNTYLAQGGISVARDKGDIKLFVEDTLKAGQYKNDSEAVEILARESISNVNKLISLGVNFDKDHNGNIDFTKEGAHSINRIVHTKDNTGENVAIALINATKKRNNIEVYENTYFADVIEYDNECIGGILIRKNEQINGYAKYVVMATGGIGGLYNNSTNQRCLKGDSLAIALKHNIELKDINYIQIHPTAFYEENNNKKLLISESIRGEGGILKNVNGERFINELLPRDVVSKAVYKEMEVTQTSYVYLDIRLSLIHI